MSVLNATQQFILQACLATSLILTAISIRDRLNCCEDEGCFNGDFECCSQASCQGMQIGDFVAVLVYIQNVFTPLHSLRMVYNQMIMATVDLTSLLELLGGRYLSIRFYLIDGFLYFLYSYMNKLSNLCNS